MPYVTEAGYISLRKAFRAQEPWYSGIVCKGEKLNELSFSNYGRPKRLKTLPYLPSNASALLKAFSFTSINV